jgi:hypothetical protein
VVFLFLHVNFLERHLVEVRLRGTRPPRRWSNKPLPMPDEEEGLKEKVSSIFPQMGSLFALCPLVGPLHHGGPQIETSSL